MDKEYESALLGLIESLPFVYLSTIDADGFPSTRAMLNLRNKELYPHLPKLYNKEKNPFTVYLTTNTSSVKMKEVQRNDKVCLYFCDSPNYRGIMLRGQIQTITDKRFKLRTWMEEWTHFYPGGILSEDFTLLRFIPDKLKSYGDLNVITEDIGQSDRK